jgi:hypothetical protein
LKSKNCPELLDRAVELVDDNCPKVSGTYFGIDAMVLNEIISKSNRLNNYLGISVD